MPRGYWQWLWSVALLTVCRLYGQSGVNLKLALNTYAYDNNRAGDYTGYQLGLDAILDDHTFILMPGVHYQVTSLEAQNHNWQLNVKTPSIHGLKCNFYLGERIIRGEWFKWKVYGGGGAWFPLSTDPNSLGLNEDDLRDVSFSLEGGTGIEFRFFTLDVLYVHGTDDVFRTIDRSKRRAWTLSAGFFF